METNFEQTFEKVSQNIKDLVKTETLVGDEFKMGEYTCRPVIKVGVGFGAGSGTDNSSNSKCHGSGGGAGGGVGMAPVGFLVSRGAEISFVPAGKNILAGILEKVPDIMEKYMDLKKEKESSREDKKN